MKHISIGWEIFIEHEKLKTYKQKISDFIHKLGTTSQLKL